MLYVYWNWFYNLWGQQVVYFPKESATLQSSSFVQKVYYTVGLLQGRQSDIFYCFDLRAPMIKKHPKTTQVSDKESDSDNT